MSLKRLILLLALLGAVAAVAVRFAAGSGGNDRQQKAPVKRSPPVSPNPTENYWTPERMKHARPLPMGIPGGRTQPDGSNGSDSSAPAHRSGYWTEKRMREAKPPSMNVGGGSQEPPTSEPRTSGRPRTASGAPPATP
jgi:hypothetical protein